MLGWSLCVCTADVEVAVSFWTEVVGRRGPDLCEDVGEADVEGLQVLVELFG